MPTVILKKKRCLSVAVNKIMSFFQGSDLSELDLPDPSSGSTDFYETEAHLSARYGTQQSVSLAHFKALKQVASNTSTV
jgi:hypothetical protein